MNIFHPDQNKLKKFMPHIAVAFIAFVLLTFGICCLFFRPSDRSIETLSDTVSSSDPDNSMENYLAANQEITSYLRISTLEPESVYDSQPLKNTYDNLCIPTYLNKIGDLYFLVDCYHDQIIYHDNLSDPLTEWNVMTDQIHYGHTLASDGLVYLADDTENNRVLVFEEKDGAFVHTQTFSDIGNRPHYIIYHEATDTFYVWSSMNGEMYLFRHNPGDSRMYLTEIRCVKSLSDTYVRSFTIMDNDIYFVSGYSYILRADLSTFEILETYPVPESISGMVQLTKIQDYFYITVSTDAFGNQAYSTILRTRDLSGLIDGEYEDIYEYFNNIPGGGTPYYITSLDGAFYMTEHQPVNHSLWRFQVEDNEIVQVEYLY